MILADLGIPEVRILQRAGMPVDLFRRAVRAEGDGVEPPRITAQQYFTLFEALQAELEDPLIGLRLGQAISVEMFQPPLFAALCSPDMAVAVQRIAKFKRLIGPIVLDVDVTEAHTTLSFGPAGVPAFPAAVGHMELTFMTHLVRLATRSPVKPLHVTFAEPVPTVQKSAFEEFFGGPSRRGETWSVRFSDLDMRRPFLTANAGMWAVFEPRLRLRLAEVDAASDTAERVRGALLELLPSGRSSVADVGKTLGMSRRSLQRKLSREDTTFQGLLDETREALARHYLGQTALSTAEISFLLGYDDPSSFFRAFQRWTGETPETIRTQLRRSSEG
jgi:AraC-like DNA-binding protein